MQSTSWIVPTVQTIHILAVAAVLSSVGMMNLRLLGLADTRTPIAEVARRFAPWLWGALLVLLASGTILIVGEPNRDLNNFAFQSKMLLLIVMTFVAVLFVRSTGSARWAYVQARNLSWTTKLMTLCVLAGWLTIAVLGRWIAYAIT